MESRNTASDSKPSTIHVQNVLHSPPAESEYIEKIEEARIGNAAQQLNVLDFDLLSRESIQFKSRATLRLIRVIIIQGISQFCLAFIRYY
jgi:hypothetical protein